MPLWDQARSYSTSVPRNADVAWMQEGATRRHRAVSHRSSAVRHSPHILNNLLAVLLAFFPTCFALGAQSSSSGSE